MPHAPAQTREELLARHADCQEEKAPHPDRPGLIYTHTCGVCPHGWLLQGTYSVAPEILERRVEILERQRLLKIHALDALTCADHLDTPPFDVQQGRAIPWLVE